MKRIDVAYALLQNAENQVLMVKNRGGTWSLPGGKREQGETLEAAVIRECMEEANAEVTLSNIAAVSEMVIAGEHVTFFVFHAKLKNIVPQKANDEIECVEWLPIAEANKLMPWYPEGVEALIKNRGASYFISPTA